MADGQPASGDYLRTVCDTETDVPVARNAQADKRHGIYDGGHVFPFARIIKDTLDWLDKYLGVPK